MNLKDAALTATTPAVELGIRRESAGLVKNKDQGLRVGWGCRCLGAGHRFGVLGLEEGARNP